MSSSPTREPYYCTPEGLEIEPETYWRINHEDGDHYFRFVELQDSAGGLAATIQDEYGYRTMAPDFMDYLSVDRITEPELLALVMLAIHA
jgi:hypothetical protein